MDGAGKSSVIRALLKTDSSFAEASIWDPFDNNLFNSAKEIDEYLCSLSPNSRLLFLTHALLQSIHLVPKDQSVVIYNSYYYKYFATEMALGASDQLIQELIKYFPKPDLVIELKSNVAVAADRKSRFSRYECGLQEASKENFIQFQSAVEKRWDSYKRADWISIPDETSIMERCAIIKEYLA